MGINLGGKRGIFCPLHKHPAVAEAFLFLFVRAAEEVFQPWSQEQKLLSWLVCRRLQRHQVIALIACREGAEIYHDLARISRVRLGAKRDNIGIDLLNTFDRHAHWRAEVHGGVGDGWLTDLAK